MALYKPRLYPVHLLREDSRTQYLKLCCQKQCEQKSHILNGDDLLLSSKAMQLYETKRKLNGHVSWVFMTKEKVVALNTPYKTME